MGYKEYFKEYNDYLSIYDLVFLFIIAIILFLLPILFTLNCKFFPDFNGTEEGTGQIGDTIGGITAPFIGFFSAVLVYLAFKAQIRSNKIIQDQFNVNLIIDTIYKQTMLIEKSIDRVNISITKNTITEKILKDESFQSNKLNESGLIAFQYFNKLCLKIGDDFSLIGFNLKKEYSELSNEEKLLFDSLKDFFDNRNTSKFLSMFTSNLDYLNKLINDKISEDENKKSLLEILNFQFDFEEIQKFLYNGIELYKYCYSQKEFESLKFIYDYKIKSLEDKQEKIKLIFPNPFLPSHK